MEEIVTVGDISWKIREMLAIEMENIDMSDPKKAVREMVKISAGIGDNDYDALTVKQRLVLVSAINKLNGIGDFTNPAANAQ